MNKDDQKTIMPGGVDEYIEQCPAPVRENLKQIRIAIQGVSPGAIETVSYFQIPGYSYPGYDYNGMFAWFSFKQPHIRLHVRPPAIQNHADELASYPTTASIISFPMGQEIPKTLVQTMVKASLAIMKGSSTK